MNKLNNLENLLDCIDLAHYLRYEESDTTNIATYDAEFISNHLLSGLLATWQEATKTNYIMYEQMNI